MPDTLVPEDFKVPKRLETDRFLLRVLSAEDVIKDYEAVMTSIDHLKETNPFGPNDKWPPKDLTIKQDLRDLKRHQQEFENKTSFAYTVTNPEDTKCLGCVYIYPSPNPEYGAIVLMWVRQSELEKDLDEELFSTVKKWVEEKWPFDKVAYPGREDSWSKFV